MIGNLSELFFDAAKRNPSRPAFIQDLESGRRIALNFSQFNTEVKRTALKLQTLGVKPDDKVVVFLVPSLELYTLILALFAVGAIPVFFDQALGRQKIFEMLLDVKPRSVIGSHRLFKWRWILPKLWKMDLISVDSSGFGIKNLAKIPFAEEKMSSLTPPARILDAPALLSFTSGTTGKPKCADRSNDILYQQHLVSHKYWPEFEGEVDMPGFPMVVLQNLVCGITTVIPNFRDYQPWRQDPKSVADQIQTHKVSRLSASPAFFAKFGSWAKRSGFQADSVKRLIVGGAPVSRRILRLIKETFPNADSNILYGSTEVEPISFMPINEALELKQNHGYPVGRLLPELQLKVVRFPQAPPQGQSLDEFAISGFGEILLAGSHVVRRYLGDEILNQNTKIKDNGGVLWHRTFDLGMSDANGILWWGGRQKENTLSHPVPSAIEYAIEDDDQVLRAAFVSESDSPTLYVLPVAGEVIQEARIRDRVPLHDCKIQIIDSLPVDSRHCWRVQKTEIGKKSKNHFLIESV